MPLDRKEVLKIAELARLEIEPGALDAFTGQFERILEYIEKLKGVGVEGVEPTSHASLAGDLERSAMREDRPEGSLPAEEALANAPDPGGGHFRVPKVLP